LTDSQVNAAVQVARSEAHRLKANVRIVTAKLATGSIGGTNTGHRCPSRYLDIEVLGDFRGVAVGGAAMPAATSGNREAYQVHAELIDADPATGQPCLISVKTGPVRPDPTAVTLFTH
jgi:hypothetical protein